MTGFTPIRSTTASRVMVLTLLGCLFGGRVVAQEPATPLVRAAKLVLSHNGQPITDWLVIQGVPDSLTLEIVPQDSLGNAVPITGFEIEVWDPLVFGVLGTEVQASQVVVRLQPRRRGQTTIQIRMSGTRQWVLVELTRTVLSISPAQAAAPGAAYYPGRASWTAGGRLSAALYSYTFLNQTAIDGKAGFIGEGYIGRDFGSGLTLVFGLGFGVLSADSLGVSVNASLIESYFRADYAFLRQSKVRPVLSAGGGGYRIRTGGTNPGIWNTSLYWMVGGGADFTVSPKMNAEIRITTQQLEEVTSSLANGHVGSLLVIGAGLRFQF
jgi:hypothetical protein